MSKIEPYLRHPLPKAHDLARHFTASAVVVAHGHILLVHHKRIGAWLPPGGHIEEREMPHMAAERETLEETGVYVEALSQHFPDTQDSDAFFLPRPLCIHAVRALEAGVDYYHIDLAFLCKPVDALDELPIINSSAEVKSAGWFKLSELAELPLAKNVDHLVALLRQQSLPLP